MKDNGRTVADAATATTVHAPEKPAPRHQTGAVLDSREHVDVLIIGAGMAGLSAGIAAMAERSGLQVAIAAPNPMYSGGCSWETHALNAAVRADDSWKRHFRDTVVGGGGINDPGLAAALCKGAPELVGYLETLGVTFDAGPTGDHDLGTYGGSSVSRGLHSSDTTGLEIMQRLVLQTVRSGCALLRDLWLVDLLVDGDRCEGGIFLDIASGELVAIQAGATVLATGGGACVYPIASISADKVASGLAIGLQHGLSVVDLEMVQFHPTGLVAPGTSAHGTLLEEELRTLGAVLLDQHGKRFMKAYDPRGEQATRDVVARSMMMEIRAGRGTADDGVYLDISGFDGAELRQRFPNSVRRLRAAGVDLITQGRIEVSPTAHFLMGGLRIDIEGKTELAGLYACGEDAGGIHGGNRLGGNGVADALVFGRLAGAAAAREAEAPSQGEACIGSTLHFYDVDTPTLVTCTQQLKTIMWQHAALLRDAAGLDEGLSRLAQLEADLAAHKTAVTTGAGAWSSDPAGFRNRVSLGHMLTLAKSIVTSALVRPQSLGAHYRTDAKPNIVEEPYSVVLRRAQDGTLASSKLVRPNTLTPAGPAPTPSARVA